MKLYRLGKLYHITPPEEKERIINEHALLNEKFAGRKKDDIQEEEQEEYKKWKKLADQLEMILQGVVFVDNPRRLGAVIPGQKESITVLTLPDSFPTLEYLDVFSANSSTPNYRVPMDDLWDHLGEKRDWKIGFADLTRSFGEVVARVQEHPRELPFDTRSNPGCITVYSPGRIKHFYSPQEVKDAKEKLNTLKRVRARYRNEDAMRRWDRTAYEALECVNAYADGAPIYLSKQEAFAAAQEGSEITSIQIPTNAEDTLIDIFFPQWRGDAHRLPWELLWEHVVMRRARDPEKWHHKDIPIEREPTELDSMDREHRSK